MKHSDIDHGKSFDFGRTSEDYAKFRDIYPASFYEALRGFGIGTPGQHVLDLGTGTGVLPRAMVPSGARFTGADISPEQIAMARQLSQGMDIDYLVCPAEDIDFLPETFDAATACQCFWYFDCAALLPKLHRALKPGGRFAVLVMNWVPAQSPLAQGSEALVLKYNPSWTGANWPGEKSIPTPEWAAPLFRMAGSKLYCEDISFTRAAWHGRMLACRGVGASSLNAEEIAAFEEDHKRYLETQPGEFMIPHQIIMMILEKA